MFRAPNVCGRSERRRPVYYLKRLALQGVLDVIDSKEATIVEFNVEVEARRLKSNPLSP
jgi:hypothetical protein